MCNLTGVDSLILEIEGQTPKTSDNNGQQIERGQLMEEEEHCHSQNRVNSKVFLIGYLEQNTHTTSRTFSFEQSTNNCVES